MPINPLIIDLDIDHPRSGVSTPAPFPYRSPTIRPSFTTPIAAVQRCGGGLDSLNCWSTTMATAELIGVPMPVPAPGMGVHPRGTTENAGISVTLRLRNAILGDSLHNIAIYLFKLFLHDLFQRS